MATRPASVRAAVLACSRPVGARRLVHPVVNDRVEPADGDIGIVLEVDRPDPVERAVGHHQDTQIHAVDSR
jgi:hypothetical protein